MYVSPLNFLFGGWCMTHLTTCVYVPSAERGSPTDSFHSLFDQLDHSNTGKLTADDLVQGLTEDYGYRMTEEEARVAVEEVEVAALVGIVPPSLRQRQRRLPQLQRGANHHHRGSLGGTRHYAATRN